MIFQAGNVHESASLLNLKEKKIDMKGRRIRTHDPEGPVYHTNTETTEHLLDGEEIWKGRRAYP